MVKWFTSCHIPSSVLVFSGSWAVLPSLPLSPCPLCCACAPPQSGSEQDKVMFLQRLQGHQNSHFFLATCHFSPGMEKVISFPHTPPNWEQSSFPLRGRVPLPFFTGWTSANENHYWVHSIYFSGDILADFLSEGKFLSQDIASQTLNLMFREKMKLKMMAFTSWGRNIFNVVP